jgi:hypothetical protein
MATFPLFKRRVGSHGAAHPVQGTASARNPARFQRTIVTGCTSKTAERHAGAMRAARTIVLAICLSACSRSSPSAHASHSTAVGIVDAACTTDKTMDSFGLSNITPLPAFGDVASIDLRAHDPSAPKVGVEAFRRWMRTARPLDRCDPSIVGWSYAPWYDGTFTMTDGRTFGLRLFLAGRAELTWPDGRRSMFDSDASILAP